MYLARRSFFVHTLLCTVSGCIITTGLPAAVIAAEQPGTDKNGAPSIQFDGSDMHTSDVNVDDRKSGRKRVLEGQASADGAFGALTDDIQSRMGFKSAPNDVEDVVITDVAPKTPAFEAGLKKGDRIVDAQIDGSALDITIERNGKMFNARLRAHAAAPPVLVAQKARMDETKRKPFTLGAEQTVIQDNQLVPEKALPDKVTKPLALDAKHFALEAEKDARLLAQYNLELVVDRSMSMKKQDCPGGLSRWAWCGEQAGLLAKSLAPYTPNGLTIVPFATEYDVFEHATPAQIERMFNGVNLQNGTRLFEPIAERLDDYFVHHKPNSKPLLIVIVTDGVPAPKFEPALVRNELVAASKRMTSANEVAVIFCQIGSQDRFGQRYLSDLDQNLTNYGARYRFVHAISFDELQETGLGPALVASIKQYAPMPAPVVSAQKAHQGSTKPGGRK